MISLTKTWHANIDTGLKTLNYRLFKNKFEFENYLNILDDRDIFTSYEKPHSFNILST
jgi:hypothetical protein